MAQPATSRTGVVVVNGLTAIVLMVWLADGLTRSPIPEQPATTTALDRAPERPSNGPINLPPPPTTADSIHDGVPADVTNLVSPMRPSTHYTSERPIEILPLRAAERQPNPAKAPIPLEPVAKRAGPSNSKFSGTPDGEGTGSPKSEVPLTPTEVVVNAEAIRTGRALLRIFEHGKGPQIDIAWPGLAARRELLHDVLRRCFGMRLALMDRAGGLYLDDGPVGRTWPIDLDRFSGFVRRPNGRITSAERRVAGRVARYHRRLPATDPVRLFPRATDAALLGGLSHLLGDDYRSSKAITASYRFRGSRVTVDEIRVDGRRIVGKIDLTRGASTTCRRTGRT